MKNHYIHSLQKLCPSLAQHLASLGIRNPIALYDAVRSRLKQYHLSGFYTPEDVIGESLRRWYALDESKRKSISWTEGWFRQTTLYCIMEFRRKETPQWQKASVRFVSLDESPALANELADLSETPEYNPQWQSIRIAMSELTKEEQELLNLSVIQELSATQLAHYYAAKGEVVRASTLRKRKERVVKKLRQIFLQKGGL